MRRSSRRGVVTTASQTRDVARLTRHDPERPHRDFEDAAFFC